MALTPTDIFLEPNLEDINVDVEVLLEAWQELSLYSVEAAIAKYPNVFDFAADRCIFFAAIQQLSVSNGEKAGEHDDQDDQDDQDGRRQDGQDPALAARKLRDEPPKPPHASQWNALIPGLDDKESTAWDPDAPSMAGLPTSSGAARSSQWPTPDDEAINTPHISSIGLVYLASTEMESEVSLGICLMPSWRQQGLSAQAITLALSWAFDEMYCHRVQAVLMDGPSRDAARTVLTRLGFTYEGTRRRAVMSPALSGWRDVTYMGLLDTEWCIHKASGGVPEPRGMWDEAFARHHREREELLQLEERLRALRRKGSMETIRMSGNDTGPFSASVETDDECASPSASSCVDPDESIPPSPVSAAFSWGDLDDALSDSPLLKGNEKGKGRAPASVTGNSASIADHASDSGSEWDLI